MLAYSGKAIDQRGRLDMETYTALKSLPRGGPNDDGTAVLFEFEDVQGEIYRFGCPLENIKNLILTFGFLHKRTLERRMEIDPSYKPQVTGAEGVLFRATQCRPAVSDNGEMIALRIEGEPGLAIDFGFVPDEILPLITALHDATTEAATRRKTRMH